MDKLPTELLHRIFILLHYQDKVECITVCRYWENTIKTLGLFHTIHISSSSDLNWLTKKIKKYPVHASKVDRLILDLYPDQRVDVSDCFSLLTNLRVLFMHSVNSTIYVSFGDMYPFVKTIRDIKGCITGNLAYEMLNNGDLPHLTTLSVYRGDISIIKGLKNTPALKYLDISSDKISIWKLELIHKYAPALTSLRLKEMEIIDSDDNYDVTQIAQINTLSICHCILTSKKVELKLLRYINQKYPKLCNLSYNTFYLNIEDSQGVNVDETGWIPLFQNLGFHWKYLDFGNINSRTIPFDILDNVGCELGTLTLGGVTLPSVIQELTRSKQVEYINNLSLTSVACPESFEWLKYFKQLKQLTLNLVTINGINVFKLNDLVCMCPSSLDSLSLEDIKLDFESFDAANPISIKQLSFTQIALPEKFTDYISCNFPFLLDLKLKGCNLQGKSFNLPSLNLLRLEIQDTFSTSNNIVLVLTLNNSKQRLYAINTDSRYSSALLNEFDPHDAPVYPFVRSLPEDQNNSEPFFHLICYSVKDVILSQFEEP